MKKLMLLFLAVPVMVVAQKGTCSMGSTCDAKDSIGPDLNAKDKPFTAGDCRNTAKHKVSADGTACLPISKCGILATYIFSDPDCITIPIKPIVSVDPNDKDGPPGPGASHFVRPSTPFSYSVSFENLATATAPAQKVVITDQLDTSKVDLTTFSLGPIYFGGYSITPEPGLQAYTAGVDLRPAMNLIVGIDARLNTGTGVVTWTFTSLDPATLQPVQDPTTGFLPANTVPPAGQGGVSFTLSARAGLPSGTAISNQANVVFDSNAPILTPTYSNTLDSLPPATHVVALPATESANTFAVQWTGTDAGSGVGAYDVYVSDNGGPYAIWQSGTQTTTANFTGVTGHAYGFYSIGTDLLGNVEGPKSIAEATTQVTIASTCATDVSGQVSITRGGLALNFSTGRFIQTVTLSNTGATAIAGPISLVLDSLSSNATLYSPSGTTGCSTPTGSPFVNLAGPLNPGSSLSITLQFVDTTKAAITHNTRVLAGSATR